jgi:hypothetical protein
MTWRSWSPSSACRQAWTRNWSRRRAWKGGTGRWHEPIATSNLPSSDRGPPCPGRVFILPAFFHFLDKLRAVPGLAFRLQFRTFGTDIPRVLQEFNAYCQGTHPVFGGQGGMPEHQLQLDDAQNIASMYRDSEGR